MAAWKKNGARRGVSGVFRHGVATGRGGVGAPEHHASFHTCSFFGLESMFAESSVYLILGQSHHTDQTTHFREKSLVLAETGS